MKRNLQITPKEPAWRIALMNSPVLTAKPDEKGYLPSYLDGIYPGGREAMMPDGKFYRMFNVGEKSVFNPTEIAGNEIPPKAYAVDSSAILAYNFFHWISPEHPLHFSDGKTYDKVYFMVRMPVLKSNPDTSEQMEVVLVNDDCHSILCFKSVMTEYIDHGPAKFAEAYTRSESYYNNHLEKEFIEYIKNFQNVEHAYNKGIAQMVKHLIAVTNLQQSNYAMAEMLTLNEFIEPEVAQQLQRAVLNIKYSNLVYILGADFETRTAPSIRTMNYINLLAHFRSTARFNEMIWQYFVLPNYAYNYNDMLAIMRSQMPDGLAEYLEARYPDLYSWEEKT